MELAMVCNIAAVAVAYTKTVAGISVTTFGNSCTFL